MRKVTSSPVRDIPALTAHSEVISFAGGVPAPELFDTGPMRAAFEHVLTEHSAQALQYSTSEGDPELRYALATRATQNGVPTHADDLIVTVGSQQALTLACAVLIDPGDVVLVEQPTYLSAVQCLAMAGARIVPVPSDEQGLEPDTLPELIRTHRPKLLYTIPTFQNPIGRTIPLERRKAIAAAAARYGVWIVEDDPYSELRYRGEAVESVAVQSGAEDRTLFLTSLSKVMAPGLRLGAIRAPGPVRRQLVIAKQAADLHTSSVVQAAAAEYLHHADLPGHIAKIRQAYAPRRDAMIAALAEYLPQGSSWSDPDGGMFVWVRLPGDLDTTALLTRAIKEQRIAYAPGAPFFAAEPDRSTLRLSFVTHSPETIHEGLARLGKLIATA